MGILSTDPHDPEKHDLKEPEGAGLGWWTVQAAKFLALEAAHGKMLNLVEAAKFLGLSKQRVHTLGSKGTIRKFEVGRYTLYPVADLQAWAGRRERGELTTGRGHRSTPVFEAAA